MLSSPSRFSAPHPALRVALTLWLVFGVAVSVRTVLRPGSHTVFPVLAASSQHWWADQPLYARYRPLDYFRYPPVFAVAFTPLSAAGLTAGGVLWNWLNLGVYGWGLWRLRRDVLPVTWAPGREALFLTVGLLGALRGLWNGQSNALAIGLLLLAAAAVARRRWWAAAGLLAAPVLVKLTPVVPALLLSALWPRKLLGRFLLALAAGLLLPFLTKAPDLVLHHYRDWLMHLLGSSGERWPGFRDAWTAWLAVRNVLFREPLALTAPIAHPLPYRALQVLSGLGVLAWCLWQRTRGLGSRQLLALTLAMGLTWLMLFGPAVEHATYVFLAPALAWAAAQRCDWRPARPLAVASLGLVLVFGWGAMLRSFPAAQPYLLAALPLGTALFAAWLCGHAATLPIADCGLRIADSNTNTTGRASDGRTDYNSCVLVFESAIRNPQSAICTGRRAP
jgi:hypothetical protein